MRKERVGFALCGSFCTHSRAMEALEQVKARFAHVMDNFQPMTLNDDNGGGDWKRHQVKKSQILKRNEKTSSGSREIWSCMEEMIQENIEKGNIIDE